MAKIDNVTRPTPYSELMVNDLIEFGSCTSEWVILEKSCNNTMLVLEQIKGKQVGMICHVVGSPVQRVI